MSSESETPDMVTQVAIIATDVRYIKDKINAMDESRNRQWDVINNLTEKYNMLRGGFRTLQIVSGVMIFVWGAIIAYYEIRDYNHKNNVGFRTPILDNGVYK